MTVFYTEAEIPKLFGSLKLEALESPAILAGVERAQSELPTLKWKARYVRISLSAALSLGNRAAAVDAFCSLYAAFVPENESMIPELVEAVAMLVVGGVPEREITGALRSDPQKAAHVAPLVIALRQRSGEVVRAPAEMLEVAADVRKRIEETEPLPAYTTPERQPVEA